MKPLYIIFSIILVSTISVILVVFSFFSNTKNEIAIELKLLHPGFTNMQIKDQEAWQELFKRTKFSEIKSIEYDDNYLDVKKPIIKIVLEITDEEQKYLTFSDQSVKASSASITLQNNILKVKMYINENLVDNELLNILIHDTFWRIAQGNVSSDTDINFLIYESKMYLQKNNLQLINLQ